MSRARSFVLFTAVAILLVSPALSQDDPPPALKGWGVAVDPDHDCRIGLEAEKLTITIPPKRHDLSIEVGNVNAPRVLQDIKGDFIAQYVVNLHAELKLGVAAINTSTEPFKAEFDEFEVFLRKEAK